MKADEQLQSAPWGEIEQGIKAPPEPVDFKLYGEDDTNPANILKDSPKGHA